jgi:hypothetical protein
MSVHLKHSTACSIAVVFLAVAGPLMNPTSHAAARGGGNPGDSSGYDDHRNMMGQLGLKALRPGESGNNQERFTEEKANPYKDTMPDVLTMKDGTKVTTPEQWAKRRAEILEDFEREVYGRIPPNVPKVTWEVTATTDGNSAGIPTVTKTLVGHVDNSAYPDITVDIQASFTVPRDAKGPVPMMLEFGFGMGGFGRGFGGGRIGRGATAGPAGPNNPGAPAGPGGRGAMAGPAGPNSPGGRGMMAGPAGPNTPGGRGAMAGRAGMGGRGGMGMGMGRGGPSWTQQAIEHGWGYGFINPGSIQADSGKGMSLRQGIIGLTNKGEPRKPDQWGALRAWGWGVSRLIDFFETHPDAKVDPRKVGIEGVSRYGKAALVTEAFDERVAVALVASSGEGGAKLHRHIFGESVENLTGSGEYHWMAGNFLKYGASDPCQTAANLPVDSHELIALCAPRPCLISYGIIARGDPQWVDAHGSFMAGVLAGPVYKLLGKRDFGTPGDYLAAPMPAVDQLIGGELAWRQHSGGHESTPNWPTFFDWAGQYIKAPPLPAAKPATN